MIPRKVLSWHIHFCLFLLAEFSFGQTVCGKHPPLFLRNSEDLISVHCMKEDLKQLRTQLTTIHPQLTYYKTEKQVDSLFAEVNSTCSSPLKTIEFIEIVSTLLQYLNDSHTNISPLVLTQFSHVKRVFPFYLEQINDKFYLQKCFKDIIPRGTECLEIDNIPISTILDKAKQFAFKEGMASEAHNQMALKLVSRIYNFYHLKNREFLTFKLVDFTGDTLEKKLQSTTLRSVLFDNEWNPKEAVWYWFDSSGTACLQLGSFSAKGNNGMRRILDEFFKEVNLRKSPHVFIDLRGNSGGYVSIKNYLISYLDTSNTDKRERYDFIRSEEDRFSSIGWWIKYRYRSYLKRYPNDTLIAKEWHYIESPNGTNCQLFYDNNSRVSRKAYRGKVSVAINGVSMSASVMFSSWIQTTGRGVLYGEMCMGGHKGTFGDAVQLKLKHSKIPFNMSTVKITPLVPADATTSGIVPDVLLKPTITQLKNGIDPIKEVLGFYKKNITKIK